MLKKFKSSLKETLKRKKFGCDIRLIMHCNLKACSTYSNVTLSCGKESNLAFAGIAVNKSFFRAVPRCYMRCCESGKSF